MSEPLTRKEAAQNLVALMSTDPSLQRTMHRSDAKNVAINALTDIAIDLLLQIDRLKREVEAKSIIEQECLSTITRLTSERDDLKKALA